MGVVCNLSSKVLTNSPNSLLQVNPRDRVQSDNSKNASTPAAEDDSIGSHTSIIAGVVVKTNKV